LHKVNPKLLFHSLAFLFLKYLPLVFM